MKRIIIFRPGALGDMLVIAPILRAMKKKFPRIPIDYLSESQSDATVISAAEAARLIPDIHEVHYYNSKGTIQDRLSAIRSNVKPAKDDLLVYGCYERTSRAEIFRDWLFFFFLGFRKFAGFKEALWDLGRRKKGIFFKTEYDRLVNSVRDLNLSVESLVYDTLAYDGPWAEEFWKSHRLDGQFVIGLCPGSKMQSKNWPVDSYLQMIRVLNKDGHLRFVIVGGKPDGIIAQKILAEFPQKTVSAIGANLLQTSGILRRAQMYLGHDTGPMHIAALHGLPCVAIYSSRDRAGFWHPYGKGHAHVRAENIPCAGCLLRDCFASPAWCLESISVESVLRAANKILDVCRQQLLQPISQGA